MDGLSPAARRQLSDLLAATRTLATVHTRDDYSGAALTPFLIEVGARPGFVNGVSPEQYYNAWNTVRMMLGMPHVGGVESDGEHEGKGAAPADEQ